MIILALSIILTLNNSRIINKTNEAVKTTDLKTIEQMASLAWSEAYLDNMHIKDEKLRLDNIQVAVDKALLNTDTSDYNIIIDGKGVTVTVKGERVNLEAGLYDVRGTLIASWDDLINKYGVDFESIRKYPSDKTSTALGTIIDNNEELKAAFELRLPEGYTTIQPFAFVSCTRINKVIKISLIITSIKFA